MRRSSHIAFIAAGLLLAGFVAWSSTRLHAPKPTSKDAGSSADMVSRDPRSAEHSALHAEQPTQSTEDRRAPRRLEVRVLRSESGTPIEGARVHLGWDSASESRVERATDRSGIASWDGLEPGSSMVTVTAPGRERTTVSIPFHRDSKGPSDIHLQVRRVIEVQLVDANGVDLAPIDSGLDDRAAQSATVVLAAACGEPGKELDMRTARPYRVTPLSWKGSRFAWRLEFLGPDAACVHVVVGDMTLAARHIEASTTGGESRLALRVDPKWFQRLASSIVVRAIAAEDGRALENVAIHVRTPNGYEAQRATNGAGRAEFVGVLASEFFVDLSAEGFASTRVRLQKPLPDEVVVPLGRGRRLQGTVVDENDQPYPRTRVGLYLADQLGTIAEPIGTFESGFDGQFEFTDVSMRPLVVFGLGTTSGVGFLPPRESLPPTALLIDAGGDVVGIRVRALVERREPRDR